MTDPVAADLPPGAPPRDPNLRPATAAEEREAYGLARLATEAMVSPANCCQACGLTPEQAVERGLLPPNTKLSDEVLCANCWYQLNRLETGPPGSTS